jgi:crossover junction endodeoxyribonuclease RusA
MTITISLPWPASELSPNSRKHWTVKAKAVKAARNEAFYTTRTSFLPIYQPARVSVKFVFYPPDYRRVDLDNLISRMKSACDGICDGLQWNDNCIKSMTGIICDPITGGGVDIIIDEV